MGCGSSSATTGSDKKTDTKAQTTNSKPRQELIRIVDLQKQHKNKNVWEDYSKAKELGAGGFGSVVIGKRNKDKAEFAIKTQVMPLAQELTKTGQDSLRVFAQEADILKSLHHPNICYLIDSYVYKPKNDPDKVHLIMVLELCKGEELFDYVAANGAFSEKDALIMFRTIVGAIAHLHTNDIVHMDLKPENFVFSHKVGHPERALKLIDFGIASKMTNTDKINLQFMSLAYSSPEILKNYRSPLTGEDMRANDVWAVGVVLYIISTGSRPFDGESEKELHADFKRGLRFHDDVHLSPLMTDLLAKLLDMNPKRRLTALQALQHPWLVSAPDSAPLFSSGMFKSLKHIGKASKFKRAIAQFMAIKGKSEQLGVQVRTGEQFKDVDKDQSGFLDKDEAAIFLQKARMDGKGRMMSEKKIYEAADALLKSVDVDGSGGIDLNEFATALNLAELTCNEDLLAKLFKQLDTDGDGFVNVVELRNAFSGLQLAGFIENADFEKTVADHSGGNNKLSLQDFKRAMMDSGETGASDKLNKRMTMAEYNIKQQKNKA